MGVLVTDSLVAHNPAIYKPILSCAFFTADFGVVMETGGNKLGTAKRLGIGRQALYDKIKAYGIEV